MIAVRRGQHERRVATVERIAHAGARRTVSVRGAIRSDYKLYVRTLLDGKPVEPYFVNSFPPFPKRLSATRSDLGTVVAGTWQGSPSATIGAFRVSGDDAQALVREFAASGEGPRMAEDMNDVSGSGGGLACSILPRIKSRNVGIGTMVPASAPTNSLAVGGNQHIDHNDQSCSAANIASERPLIAWFGSAPDASIRRTFSTCPLTTMWSRGM